MNVMLNKFVNGSKACNAINSNVRSMQFIKIKPLFQNFGVD